MADDKKPMLDEPTKKFQPSKLAWCIAAASAFVIVALATTLAVLWIKGVPCSSSSGANSMSMSMADNPTKFNTNTGKQSAFPDTWLKFFHISDLHVDPEYVKSISTHTYCRNYSDWALADYAAPYGRPGCDAPELLVRDAFRAMKTISREETPDFIIVTGDMAAHSLGTPKGEEVLQAIDIATDALKETFRKTYVFPCLGNNDIPEDYYIPPHPQGWYTAVMNKWNEFIFCKRCYWPFDQPPVVKREFRKTFITGGYYKAQLAPKLTLLILNTNYFSVWATVQTKLFLKTAEGQLEWMRSELQRAEDHDGKVIISGHIPPGLASHGQSPLWFDNYTETYVNLTAKRYPHVIGGQIFGHQHRDDFRLFFAEADEPSVEQSSAIILTGAISPVYSNNPSFRLVYLNDETKAFVDYKQWYLNLATTNEHNVSKWFHEYTFSESFPSCLGQVINNQRILDLTNGVISSTDDDTWLHYIWHRQAEYLPDADTFSQNLQYCCMRSSNTEELDGCKKRHPFIPG